MLVALWTAFLFGACMSNRMVRENLPFPDVVTKLTGKPVLLLVADYPLEGRLIGMEDDDLIVQGVKETWRLPASCVSVIQTDSGGHGAKGMAIGGLFGAILGGAGGWLVAREAATSDVSAIGHPVTLGVAVGGAAAGIIVGAGRKTIRQFRFSTQAEIYVLHEEAGETLTPSEIKMFGVFEDLKKENEQLLLVQTVRYGEDHFLILYDIFDGQNYLTRIRKVNSGYIRTQEEKIRNYFSRIAK